ncbi:MAG TPA: hypothetical protein VHP32_02165 [Ignavibacteria bacterium]|nr:hypothetical protein [Ignavibacteria bacterium]
MEFLYDEGFGRDIKFGSSLVEVFTKDYYFEHIGYFKIKIDVWFSYGYERLFYEISVPMINYRDKNDNVRWLD